MKDPKISREYASWQTVEDDGFYASFIFNSVGIIYVFFVPEAYLMHVTYRCIVLYKGPLSPSHFFGLK
jgi:hypothetical protein